MVLWRTDTGELHAGSGVCPHLGAPLRDSRVVCGTLVCHWHGLALDGSPFAGWRPFPVHDDGVLVWVRLDELGGEEPTEFPVVPVRPAAGSGLDAVYTTVGRCEPEDVVANRLDPWHGSWFHPYAFSHLAVDDDASDDQVLVVDVTFRLSRTWGVPVRAEFTCPDSRTIVMHITEGEGVGSVVETHATPLGLGPDGLPQMRRRAPMGVDVPDEKWNDWRWQLSNRVNELEEVAQILNLTDEEREGLSAPDKFRVDITPY